MKNRKKYLSVVCLLLSAALMATSLTACGDKTNDPDSGKGGSSSKKDPSSKKNSSDTMVKMLYKNEKIAFPVDVDYVDNICTDGTKMFFIHSQYDYDEKTQTSKNQYFYYVLGMDGSVVSKTEITPKKTVENEEIYFGNTVLNSDGTFWVIENHIITAPVDTENFEGDLSSSSAAVTAVSARSMNTEESEETSAEETDAEETEETLAADEVISVETAVADEEAVPVDVEYEQTVYLKRFSADGKELVSKDVSKIPELSSIYGMESTAYISQIKSDSEGKIYICKEDYMQNTCSVIVFDSELNFICEAVAPSEEGSNGWTQGVFIGNDGKLYILRTEYSQTDNINKTVLYFFNLESKKLEAKEGIEYADYLEGVSDGGGDYLFYASRNNIIYGYKTDGTFEELYNTVNNGLDVDYINKFVPNGDGFMVVSNDYSSDRAQCFVYVVNKRAESEIKEKIEVKLSAYYLDNAIRSAVANYNDSDGDYAIIVTDYSQYDDYSSENEEEHVSGLTKLNADIAAGNIPDIMCSYNPSFASKGLYLDLNTLIDGEDGLNRDEYSDFLFRGCEDDGKLYSIPIGFTMQGYAEKKEIVPNDGAITEDELTAILNAHEGMSVTREVSREYYLQYVLNYSENMFYDAKTGEAKFNTPEFIKLLEEGKKCPEKIEYDEDFDWEAYEAQFVTNKTLAENIYISTYDSLRYTESQFGGKGISITGYPGLGTNPIISAQNAIMISSKSAHPDAGWQLIKSALSEEAQDKQYYFPVNRNSLKKKAEKVLESQYYTNEEGEKVLQDFTYYVNGQEVKTQPIDQAAIDRINALMEISVVSNDVITGDEFIMDIINEEAAAFYAGTNSAETAAGNIQSRVSLYLSEQS